MADMTNEKKAQLSDERIVGIALDMGLRGMPSTFVAFARAVLAASSPSPEEAEAAPEKIEGYPSDWVRLVLAVSPSGIYHAIGGDTAPKRHPDDEDRFYGMERLEKRLKRVREGAEAARQMEPEPSSRLRDAAYDQIDRYLRNNLDDEDYADYSQALDLIYTTPPVLQKSEADMRDALEFFVKAWDGGDVEWFKNCYEAVDKARTVLAKPSEAEAAGTAGGARLLSEDELLAAIQSCGRELHGRIALTFESGPYDIDRPTLVADKLARAIQSKFCEVNGLASPSSAQGEQK